MRVKNLLLTTLIIVAGLGLYHQAFGLPTWITAWIPWTNETEMVATEVEVHRSTDAKKQVRGDRMIDESFSVTDGGMLRVRVPDADIELVPGRTGEARVEVYLSGRDMERARAYFEDLRWRVEATSTTLYVETDRRSDSWNWDRRGGAQIHVLVTLPVRFDADLNTSDGDVRIERLEGNLTLKTSDGDLDLGDLRGETLSVRTSDGDVVARHLEGRIDVVTSDGDLQLGELSGPAISVRTSDGDIDARRIRGDRIDLRTSDGDVVLREVEGPLRGTTSDGNIEVTLIRADELDLRTSDGNITIYAPSSLQADINLRADSPQLDRAFALDGRERENLIEGRINGGGPRIHATAGDGSVRLMARNR